METQHHDAEAALDGSGAHIETAHQRMLSYLKALHVPLRMRYELAARALELAEQDRSTDDGVLPASLRHLNELLQERLPQRFGRELGSLAPMPPLNRGAMVPVVIDRSGPFTFFSGLLAAAAVRLFTPPLRRYVLVAILAAVAALYWYAFYG
jgi:hypothetical protein